MVYLKLERPYDIQATEPCNASSNPVQHLPSCIHHVLTATHVAVAPDPRARRVAREDFQFQFSLPREKQRTKHDSLTAPPAEDSASRSAGVINNQPGPSSAAVAASLRQPLSHLRLTSLGRIAPTRDSLDSPTRPSSRLSQESLSSVDYHPRRPGLDDKRISLNTFLSATTPPWAVPLDKEESNRQKMHQTSSRLLRQTDDDRPFTRDLKDLFSTLMVSLPLTPHRVRFTKVEHTFTTDEALTNLGSLKFSQSNRMPDPKDPSRIVTTTTTTTFSMAKEMARTVCNRFVEARFVESLDGKTDFSSRSSVWQLTPKGMRVLTRFCQRNGIHQRHVNELLDSPRNTMQLVILERVPENDNINIDRGTIEVVFRRFCGEEGPNLKSTATADSESIHDYATGLVGVHMMRSRKQFEKDTPYMFTGKSALDWLMDCCMVVNRKEACDIAQQFMVHQLIVNLTEERNSPAASLRSFLLDYNSAKRSVPAPRLDLIRETLASAYSLYNAFLAPGSPCELNIDHNLRNALASRMTRAVGEDTEMIASLDEVATLFDQAQTSVFKLMASDSVPKFSRDPKYIRMLENRTNYDQMNAAFSAASVS
ncbi:RGS-domain-containing protein [Aureobasidium pullulans]|uniref:RGS-domain-containing protein n=1 Tax=Aureobasidium pullulans TaxID=5580 RepID=A0A4S9F1R5_AURPU|nr:RGS-domain-containing protein [Aureobasidium pullulans]